MRRLPVVELAVAGALAMAACSSGGGSGEVIAVTSRNTECRVARAELPAGNHRFRVENTGNQPSSPEG